MIPARDTKSRWVVSLEDEALSCYSGTEIKEYSDTRDLSVLGIDPSDGIVPKTGNRATLFLVEPLKQKYAHLAEVDKRNQFTLQAVFAAHVVDSRNAPEGIVRRGDRLSDEAMENMPLDTVEEIATVIIEMATAGGRGVTAPFSLPGGFWDRRFNMEQMLARNARRLAQKENGTNKETDPE